MQKKVKIALIAGLAVITGAGTLVAAAQAGGWGGQHRGHGGMMRMFSERYDTNQDGKITQAEIDANRTEWHGKFDGDKNGSLSLKEFEALWLEANRQRMVREYQRFDKDGDAAVTLDEYKKPLARFVQEHDRNGDGALSKEDRRKRWGDRDDDDRGQHMRNRGNDNDDDNDDQDGR
jgi:hypothetical protein